MEEEGWRGASAKRAGEGGKRKNVFAGPPKIGSLHFFVDAWVMNSLDGEVGEQ